MRTDWYKNVNPNLDRLAELLGMAGGPKPSHGYTVAEKAPEVVTAPGVYFPAERGQVVPLESRQGGGSVSPSLDATPWREGEQERFQEWANRNSVNEPLSPLHYYDNIAAFRAGINRGIPTPPERLGHFPDTYKLPGHPTFSNESIYAKPPLKFGSWEGEKFIPHEETIKKPSKSSDDRRLDILESIISNVKPSNLESRQFGGPVIPSVLDELDKSKLDILKSAISVLKPPQKQSYGERTSAYGSRPSGSEKTLFPSLPGPPSLPSTPTLPTAQSYGMQPEATKLGVEDKGISEGDLLWQKKRAEGGPGQPGWDNPAQDLWEHKREEGGWSAPMFSRAKGGSVMPSTDSIDLVKDEEGKWFAPMFPRQAGGTVIPPADEDEMNRLRRLLGLGPPTAEPGQFYPSVSPESLELASREKWETPGYPERRLAEARKEGGMISIKGGRPMPSVTGVTPGFEKGYYEAHPEERLMDYITEANKPVTDMYTKLIEEARTRQQGYGRGFGPTPIQRRFGAKEPEYGKEMPELAKGLGEAMALPEKTLAGLTKGRKAERVAAPHLVQTATGEYVWATPGGVLPAGIMGPSKQEPSTVDDRRFDDIQTRIRLNKPVTDEEKAWSESYKERKTLGPRVAEELLQKDLLSDQDANWLSGKLANKEMVPSQLRTFIGFGSVGQKNLSKVMKNLRQNFPDYNFALAELAYTGDKAEITKNKNLQATVLTFEKTAIQNAKQVDALSRQINVSKIPALNNAILTGEIMVGASSIEAQYIAAWRTFINEYARIATSVSGGGITSDAARREIETVLRRGYAPEQVQSVVRQLVLEMEHRRYGFEKGLHDVMSNWGVKPEFEPKLPTAQSIETLFTGTPTPLVGKAGGETVKESSKRKPGETMDEYDKRIGGM